MLPEERTTVGFDCSVGGISFLRHSLLLGGGLRVDLTGSLLKPKRRMFEIVPGCPRVSHTQQQTDADAVKKMYK